MATPAKTPAPSIDYLLERRAEIEAQFRDEDESIDDLRLIREQRKEIPLASELRLVSVPLKNFSTITDEIDRVTATLSINPPVLQVTPVNETDKAQRNATLREKISTELLAICGRRDPEKDAFRSLIDALVGDGGACTKVIYLPDVWQERNRIRMREFEDDEGYEDGDPKRTKPGSKSRVRKFEDAVDEYKRAAGPPIGWYSVDIRTVYPVYSGGKLAEVFEIQERSASAVFRQYRLGRDAAGNIVPDELGQPVPRTEQNRAIGQRVTLLEHWDSEWCSTVVLSTNYAGGQTWHIPRNDRERLLQWRHGLGRVPYVFSTAKRPNYWSGRKTGWGVAHSKAGLVLMKAFLLVIFANLAARDTMAPLQRVVVDPSIALRGDDGAPKAGEIVKWELGGLYENPPNTQIMPIQFPQMSYLERFWALVTQEIQHLESTRVNPDVSGSDIGAGYAIQSIIAEGSIRHDPIGQSGEWHVEQVVRLMWLIVRTKVKDTIWVHEGSSEKKQGDGWLSAGPEDLTDGVKLTVTIDPKRASAELMQLRYHAEMVKDGFESLDDAIEAMGGNPDEVRLGRAMDRLRQAPWYIALQDKQVFQEFARGDEVWEKAAKEIMALLGEGGIVAGGPGGLPVEGGVPPGPGPGPGGGQIPNFAALAEGASSAPPPIAPVLYGPPAPSGPPPGGRPGVGPGLVLPTAGAMASVAPGELAG